MKKTNDPLGEVKRQEERVAEKKIRLNFVVAIIEGIIGAIPITALALSDARVNRFDPIIIFITFWLFMNKEYRISTLETQFDLLSRLSRAIVKGVFK